MQTCPRAYISNYGLITNRDECPATNQVPAGSTCRYACEPGHVLVGSSEVTCGLDGEWDSLFPYCEGKQWSLILWSFKRSLGMVLARGTYWLLHAVIGLKLSWYGLVFKWSRPGRRSQSLTSNVLWTENLNHGWWCTKQWALQRKQLAYPFFQVDVKINHVFRMLPFWSIVKRHQFSLIFLQL